MTRVEIIKEIQQCEYEADRARSLNMHPIFAHRYDEQAKACKQELAEKQAALDDLLERQTKGVAGQ